MKAFKIADLLAALEASVENLSAKCEALFHAIHDARAVGEYAQASELETQFRKTVQHGVTLHAVIESVVSQWDDPAALITFDPGQSCRGVLQRARH